MYANGTFKNPFTDFDFSKFAGDLGEVEVGEGVLEGVGVHGDLLQTKRVKVGG